MKRSELFIVFLGMILLSLVGVSAEACKITPSLISQDPYLATPGDYVKLVFQLDGIENPECKTIEFGLIEQYPLIFDPDTESKITIKSNYEKDFSSSSIVRYKVRVDENALDGDNPIEVQFKYGNNLNYEIKQFNLEVQDTRADFEIHIKDYSSVTKILTFEVLNIGKTDVQALTLTIPKQENIQIKTSNINNAGDLDSQEYTTADFEANPKQGEITVNITYTDSIGERRTIEKSVSFEPEYFQGRVEDQKKGGVGAYIVPIVIVLLIAWFVYRRIKKKKAKKHALHR